jgi:hypothetical protein
MTAPTTRQLEARARLAAAAARMEAALLHQAAAVVEADAKTTVETRKEGQS